MGLASGLQTCFRCEKMTGWRLVLMGLAAVCFTAFLWRCDSGGFRPGVTLPLWLLGLAGIGGGAGLALRSARQVPALEAAYRADARAMASV